MENHDITINREDLLDIFKNVSPQNTPFLNKLKSSLATPMPNYSGVSAALFAHFEENKQLEKIDKSCPELKRLLEHRREKK